MLCEWRREKRKKCQHSASTVLAELVSIQLEREKRRWCKKGKLEHELAVGWTHRWSLACSAALSLSLAALTGPGWPSGVNLSLRLGSCAWKKAFQEEQDTIGLMQEHFLILILKLQSMFHARFTELSEPDEH